MDNEIIVRIDLFAQTGQYNIIEKKDNTNEPISIDGATEKNTYKIEYNLTTLREPTKHKIDNSLIRINKYAIFRII